MKIISILVFITAFATNVFCQDSRKGGPRLDAPFMLDSTSTMFFPVDYGQNMISGPKLATFDGYSANILVYDFTKDSYRFLFDKNTFVKRLLPYPDYSYNSRRTTIQNKKWLFLLVKPADTNGNGRLDDNDASVAYATDARGENLRALTTSDVSVVNITFYDKQGFALLYVQRDTDGDKSFKYEDKVFYYQKIDLNDLAIGKPIELNGQ